MCLTGVDYFSTLAYQPSVAFKNAGTLAPFATVGLILLTLLGALPVYYYVCSRSHSGQGSIGMWSRLVTGWAGKLLILVLLGFAATDFIITKTISAADAAEHLLQNPLWPGSGQSHVSMHRQQLFVTIGLLVLLGAVYMRGFKEVIGLAVFIVGAFLLLNAIVIVSGLIYLADHPERITLWLQRVKAGDWYIGDAAPDVGWGGIVLISLLLVPKLALGLSGFETGVAVMPLIRGKTDDNPQEPKGRIRNTRKLLITAAVTMSLFLLGSSFVVTTLIEPSALVNVNAKGAPPEAPHDETASATKLKPPAKDRALAYLAHGQGPIRIAAFCGETFGTVYDIVTVIILWFAGASAVAGLLNLVPQYLPRYGMAPEWTHAIKPLVLLITGISLAVTFIFDASVDSQTDAYATGVIVLMTSDSIASIIDRWRRREGRSWLRRMSWGFGIIAAIFCYTTFDIVRTKPDGIKIAAFFIGTILLTSFISRIVRSREMRFKGFHVPDIESKLYWDTIKHLELSVLVPHRPGRRSLPEKETTIRREHRIPRDVMIIFVEVELLDPSDFIHEPWLEVRQEEGRYVMKITHASSIAHTLAAVGLEMAKVGRPPEIHFGWTEETPWSGTIGFLLFGEGNIPWMVRELVRKAEPDPERRPFIVVAGA